MENVTRKEKNFRQASSLRALDDKRAYAFGALDEDGEFRRTEVRIRGDSLVVERASQICVAILVELRICLRGIAHVHLNVRPSKRLAL